MWRSIAKFSLLLLILGIVLGPIAVLAAVCGKDILQQVESNRSFDEAQIMAPAGATFYCGNKVLLGNEGCKKSVGCASYSFQCHHHLWTLPQNLIAFPNGVEAPWALPPRVVFPQYQPIPPLRPPIFV